MNIKRLVAGALFAALTFTATTAFKIPTPTFGYVHLGDCFVLMSGFLLGPAIGGLAAGIGSMLSDLLGGYALWAPGTFFIKLAVGAAAGMIYRFLKENRRMHMSVSGIIAGISAELIMVLGYFLYNILMLSLINTGAERLALGAAAAQSLAEIPFNICQGVAGIFTSSLLLHPISRLYTTQ